MEDLFFNDESEHSYELLGDVAKMVSRLGKNPSIADLTTEIEKLEAKSVKNSTDRHILAQLFNARAVAVLNGTSKAVEEAKASAGREIRALFKWGWLPRIPFYLLLPIILYFAYSTRDVAGTVLKAGAVWGLLFLLWCGIRVALQSLKFDPFAPPGGNFFLFCKVCARMTSQSYSLPGFGDACLCYTHEQKVNSMLQDGVKSVVHFTAWNAAQDAHRALELWPDFKEAQETLASIGEMDPTAVTPLGLPPESQRVADAIDEFMAARPEDRDRWEPVRCPRCNGQGECSLCLGKRTVSAYRFELRLLDKPDVPILCPACDGNRVVSRLSCHSCRGTGTQNVPRKEFRRILRKAYARPFSKYHGVKAWEHGILRGLILGPLSSLHIKRLEAERDKVMQSLFRGDQDFPGIRFGAFTAYLVYGLCIADYLLRHRIEIAATVTLVVLVFWILLFRTTRKSFRN